MAQLQLGLIICEMDTECEIRLDHEFSVVFAPVLQDVLQTFSNAANQGMFCCSSCDPTFSSFELIEHPSLQTGERALWRYHAHFIDPGGYRVLVNLLKNQLPKMPRGLLVAIGSPSGGTLCDVDWSALSTWGYPNMSRPPFVLEDNLRGPPDTDVVIRIEFGNELSKDVIGRISFAFDSWEQIVGRGGFCNKKGGEEAITGNALIQGDYYLISPCRIEYVLYALDVPIEIFSALVNILIWIHRTVTEIVLVEME